MISRDATYVVQIERDGKVYVILYEDIMMFVSGLDRQVLFNRTCDRLP